MSEGDEGQGSSYNPLFEHYVSHEMDATPELLRGMIAYCLYKNAKREWASDHVERFGRKLDQNELEGFTRTWTPSRRAGALTEADAVLNEFTGIVLAANAPQIREDALRGTFWKSVGTSMFAALLYTLLLIAIVIVLRFGGIDLLSLIAAVKTPASI